MGYKICGSKIFVLPGLHQRPMFSINVAPNLILNAFICFIFTHIIVISCTSRREYYSIGEPFKGHLAYVYTETFCDF
jgi:hypothetical protein